MDKYAKRVLVRTWVLEAVAEGAECLLDRSVCLAVDSDVATGGISTALQDQWLC